MTTRTTSRTSLSDAPACGYVGELKRAVAIANHYGFRLVNPIAIKKEDREHATRYSCPHEHPAIVRLAEEHFAQDIENGEHETLLVAHIHKVPYKNCLRLRLEVIGDGGSSAEGLLFQTTSAILRAYGHTKLLTAVNSVGGPNTSTGFTQSVSSYIRSQISHLHPECRDGIRANLFAPLQCDHDACKDIRTEAPQSLNFLSERGRRHFKEVLEYLENLELPYTVDPWLVGSEHYTTHTVFSMGIPERSPDESSSVQPISRVLAWGERYDHLSHRLGTKRPFPAMHATIDLGTRSTKERYTKAPSARTPHAYVIQVGLPAKVKALIMHEAFRPMRLKVSVTLHKKSIAEQMEHANMIGAPYLIIIGHREVTDGVALVRHLPTNQQYTVPFSKLPTHLKGLVRLKKR